MCWPSAPLSPSAGAFAAQECTPMETALVSLTFSGNMTLVDQLGSRSAELAQPQQFRELHAPTQPQTQPIEFNVTVAGKLSLWF